MKKLSVLPLILVLILLSAAGTSMAYFTDQVTATAVIASGNIQITQYEQERDDAGALRTFTQQQKMMPLVQNGSVGYETVTVDGHDVSLRDDNSKNYLDKIVNVKNSGSNPAYLRTFVAIPTGGLESSSPDGENWIRFDTAPSGDWSWQRGGSWDMVNDVVIGGVEYDIYVATYFEALPAGEFTSPSLLGIYMDSMVTNDDSGFCYENAAGNDIALVDTLTPKVLVATEAVQTTTFSDPYTALDTVFGKVADGHHPWENADDGQTALVTP